MPSVLSEKQYKNNIKRQEKIKKKNNKQNQL